MSFDTALAKTVGREGDYSDHPDDSGGKTRFGITQARAAAHGYTGDMRNLSWQLARNIYESDYWEALKCEQISLFSSLIADELFDTGVNCGIGVSGVFLQRGLNVLNRKQRDYADLVVDGIVGRMTVNALSRFLQIHKGEGELVMYRLLNCLQGTYYVELAERREKDESFVRGWFLNRVMT